MPEPAFIPFGVAVLAAGKSTRMGRPKMLLPWGGTSVLGRCLDLWAKLDPARIAVVCDPRNQPVLGELDRLGFSGENRIMNPRVELGMFGSVRCAANWSGWPPGLTHYVLSLGDQPMIREATLKRVVECARAESRWIWQPARLGRPRHPVVLPAHIFAELRTANVPTFKEFLDARPELRRQVEVDDPGLDCDLDTPEDYERAKAKC